MEIFSHYDSPLSPKYQCKIYDANSRLTFPSVLHYYVYSVADVIRKIDLPDVQNMSFQDVEVYYNELLNIYKPLIQPIEMNLLIHANMEKFSQNQILKEYLLSTKGDLYYHSSFDFRWGVTSTHEELIEKSGYNLFGLTLMIVRGLLSEQ